MKATPAILIAGTHSGCGKTTVTLGLMAALKRRGLRVAPFKVGPDFIDPGHHTRVTGTVSRNLDGWMLSREYNTACFSRNTQNADIAVVEGVMGLFDGYDGKSDAGSAAQMARWLDLPVVLVVDARSMARSAAALVQGFERFDPDLRFAGVVFNNLGSERHLDYLKEALEGNVDMPCLGGLLRETAIAIPERHLGLVTEGDHPLSEEAMTRLADLMEERIDIDGLLTANPPCPPLEKGGSPDSPPFPKGGQGGISPKGESEGNSESIRIGVARDNAFCFYYEDNLDILRGFGADLVFFSPITDAPPDDLHGLYLGGGYPELFARPLSDNRRMREWVNARSREGLPVYAECGGFMYLCDEIHDLSGDRHAMAGVFPYATRMLPKLKALGYREIRLTADTLLGPPGTTVRGHEFHYSERIGSAEGVETVYAVADRKGGKAAAEGFRRGRTIGSYIHLHFGSRPSVAEHFVRSCLTYRQERTR